MEDKVSLGEGLKVSMSDLAKRVGLLHTVGWREPSLESKTQRESHSIQSLSASTHRSGFLHILMFTVRCSAQQRRFVVRWQISAAFSFLGLARIHPHRRTQSRTDCLHTVKVLFRPSHRHLGDAEARPRLPSGVRCFKIDW